MVSIFMLALVAHSKKLTWMYGNINGILLPKSLRVGTLWAEILGGTATCTVHFSSSCAEQSFALYVIGFAY